MIQMDLMREQANNQQSYLKYRDRLYQHLMLLRLYFKKNNNNKGKSKDYLFFYYLIFLSFLYYKMLDKAYMKKVIT